MPDTKRPNIVIILVDDMGYSDLGCYGSEIHTPNLDSLATGGQRYTHFYNAARCCPTRASLLTGLHPHQAGMGGMVNGDDKPGSPYRGTLNSDCVTIAEVLKRAGYATYMSGKWHVGEKRPHWPVDRGFDRHFGLISGAMNYFDITKAKSPNVKRRFAKEDKDYTPPNEGFYATNAFTDYAVDRIDEHPFEEKPFFLYLAYTAPHWPLHALPEDIAKYADTYKNGWQPLREERYKALKKLGLINADWQLSPPDEQAEDWDKLTEEKKAHMAKLMAIYAAQIDRMDQGVGKVMDSLRDKDQLDNTLILFLADNGACAEGGPLGFDLRKGEGGEPGTVDSYLSYGRSWSNASNTPFRRHKSWIHEGGIATPLIAHWPDRIKAGGIVDQVGHIIDFMPTCCEISGATYPAEHKGKTIRPMEGKSLVPVFDGKNREPHELLHWEHFGKNGILSGKWKLVMEKAPNWELYDMEADRTELHNLIDEKPDLAAELEAKFQAWAKKVGVR